MKKEIRGSSFDSFLEEEGIDVEYRRRCRRTKLVEIAMVVVVLLCLLCALVGAFFSPHWSLTILGLFSAGAFTWVLCLLLKQVLP